MEKQTKSTCRSWVVIILVVGLLVIAVPLVRIAQWLIAMNSPCPPGASACLTLEVEGEPTLGADFDLVAGLQSRRTLPDEFEVSLHLPEAIELVEGQLTWTTELAPREKTSTRIGLRVNQPGEWVISGLVAWVAGGVIDDQVLYLISSSNAAKVADRATPNHWFPPNIASGYYPRESEVISLSQMELSGEPGLNQPFEVTYQVSAAQDLSLAQIGVIIPPMGWEVVQSQAPPSDETVKESLGGAAELVWSGSLPANQPVRITGAFNIIDVGRGGVFGYLRMGQPNEDGTLTIQEIITDGLFLEVNELVGTYRTMPKQESP